MALLGFAARSFILLNFDMADYRLVRQSGERAFESVAFNSKLKDDVHSAVLELARECLLSRVIDKIKRAHRLGLAIHNFIRRDSQGV